MSIISNPVLLTPEGRPQVRQDRRCKASRLDRVVGEWKCSLPSEHTGPHVACGGHYLDGEVRHLWAQTGEVIDPSPERCADVWMGHTCTLHEGHVGPHARVMNSGRPLAAWANVPSPDPGPGRGVRLPDGQTFTEEEIRRAVLEWDEGCDTGKWRFLRSLGIEPQMIHVTVTMAMDLPRFDRDGDETDVEDQMRHLADEISGFTLRYGVEPESVEVIDHDTTTSDD